MGMKWALDDFLKIINFILARRRTKKGLLSAIGFVIAILYSFTPFNKLSLIWQIRIILLILLVVIIVWLFDSGRYLIPSKKITVTLALKSIKPDSQKVINNTISIIDDKLKSLNLKEKFRVFEIGTDIFSTNKKAENYIKQKKINLVIHGSIYSGNKEGKYKYDLNNFAFSYIKNLPKDSPGLDKQLEHDIGLMITQRNWIIEESNDLIDIEKVSINLVEIILSVIAIGLHRTLATTEISIQLIEVVLPLLERRIDPQHRTITVLNNKSTIKVSVDLLRSGRLRDILYSCYFAISTLYRSEEEYEKVEEVLNKALIAGADKIECYVRLAHTKYRLGDLQSSREYTAKINQISKNVAPYLVNMAFFSILDKEYEKIPYYYKALLRKISDKNKHIIDDVLSFLNEREKDDPSELGYLSAIGILTYFYRDKEKGKNLLKEFLEKSESKIEYVKVSNKIKNILKIK